MSILQVVGKVRPDEIYNLAAQSHVQVSFDSPEFTADVDALGVLRVLEAVRLSGLKDSCRIYQASTSELYGKVEEVPQNENTPFHPYSPYAVAKQYGYWIVKEYREKDYAYSMIFTADICKIMVKLIRCWQKEGYLCRRPAYTPLTSLASTLSRSTLTAIILKS